MTCLMCHRFRSAAEFFFCLWVGFLFRSYLFLVLVLVLVLVPVPVPVLVLVLVLVHVPVLVLVLVLIFVLVPVLVFVCCVLTLIMFSLLFSGCLLSFYRSTAASAGTLTRTAPIWTRCSWYGAGTECGDTSCGKRCRKMTAAAVALVSTRSCAGRWS